MTTQFAFHARILASIIALLLFSVSARAAETAHQAAFSPIQLREALSQSGGVVSNELREQIQRLFGKSALMKGKPAAKIEQTTVAWAIMDNQAARVVKDDGTVLGPMVHAGSDGLQVLALDLPNFSDFNYHVEAGGMTRVAGNVKIEHYEAPPESRRDSAVPEGKLEKFQWSESKVFPGTIRDVTVYIPSQYERGNEACLMVWQDGSRHADPSGQMRAPVVMDHLIQSHQMPVTIGVFIDPGRKPNQKAGDRAANRGFEYDSLGDAYVRMVLDEVLPQVEQRYGVRFKSDPACRAIAGGSSGGICAFTAAWERPDQFGKVLSWVGSFVDLRGGNAYPYLIRITEKKPIRIYMLDGVNDLDNKFGNWPLANRMMAASLKYMGYDFRFDMGDCFHGSKGMSASLPEALRWLWRD